MLASAYLGRPARVRTVANPHPERIAARIEPAAEEPAALSFLRLPERTDGGPEELVDAAVARFLDLVADLWPNRSKRSGHQPAAARNLRLYFTRSLLGASWAELGRAEDPPISKQSAARAASLGKELVERVRPTSRFNPDRPPARAERRRGQGPGGW